MNPIKIKLKPVSEKIRVHIDKLKKNWDKILLVAFVAAFIICCFWSIAKSDAIDDIIPAIIKVESNGNSFAVGTAGEIGLMQIKPVVLKEWNTYATRGNMPLGNADQCKYYRSLDLYKPCINMLVGEWYLRRLRDYYLKDVRLMFYDRFFKKYQTGKRINDTIIFDEPFSLLDFRRYIKTVDELRLALILAAYNGGITRLKDVNYDINKMPKETQEYIKKVMRVYKYGQR